MKKYFLKTLVLLLCCIASLNAHTGEIINPNKKSTRKNTINADCLQATAQMDMHVNNVRARLLNGGDFWWDLVGEAKYVVPGDGDVSALFAGGLWMGGFDPAGNLKIAAQQYRGISGNDFFPGPGGFDGQGNIDEEICLNWDRFFRVTSADIDLHIDQYKESLMMGIPYDPETIPGSVKGWPARGNPFFFEVNGFDLNGTPGGVASYYDQNNDGLYNPEDGDFPSLQLRGCIDPLVPDEMIFWIVNDISGIHTNTYGAAIGMEVQTTAFAFQSSDALNDATCYYNRLLHRSVETIDSFYFGLWYDPDLGCHQDDYIGCNPDRGLSFVYNMDDFDGNVGGPCVGGSGPLNTYGDEVPLLGIDFFRGPIAPKKIGPNGELLAPAIGESFDTLVEESMSSFTYYNSDLFSGPSAAYGPSQAPEFYNYLSGSWRSGEPFTIGGDGYNPASSDITKYAFPGDPDDPLSWSMCSENLLQGDRRPIHSAGPLRFYPGTVNEMVFGVVWVGDEPTYPCPDLSRLFDADDHIQDLFDNCFDETTSAFHSPCLTHDSPNCDEFGLSVFPNPSEGSFNVQLNSYSAGSGLLEISDVHGRPIHYTNIEVQEGSSNHAIHVNIPSGLYYMSAQLGQRRVMTKLIVQ